MQSYYCLQKALAMYCTEPVSLLFTKSIGHVLLRTSVITLKTHESGIQHRVSFILGGNVLFILLNNPK